MTFLKAIWQNRRKRFFTVMSMLFLLLLAAEIINGRFWLNDFKVYHAAANALLHGETVYNVSFGLDSGFFKYSPFSLFLFVPLALIPFAISKVIYYCIISVLIIFTIRWASGIWASSFVAAKKIEIKVWFLTSLIVATHLFRELHLGNINIVLLFFLLIILQKLLKKKDAVAGLLLGLVILIKPHFLVLLPLLLLRSRFKAIAYSVGFILIGLIVPALFLGMKENMHLHEQWFGAMLHHNASIIEAPDTIYSILYSLFLKWVYPQTGAAYTITLLSSIAIAVMAMVLLHIKQERASGKESQPSLNLSFEYCFIIALVPTITLTDTEHFLLTIPLIAFLLHYLFYLKKQQPVLLVAVIVAFVLYGGNWGDLSGEFSGWATKHGLLGIGNIIILTLGVYLSRKRSNA